MLIRQEWCEKMPKMSCKRVKARGTKEGHQSTAQIIRQEYQPIPKQIHPCHKGEEERMKQNKLEKTKYEILIY